MKDITSFAPIAHAISVILKWFSIQAGSDTFVDPYNIILSVYQNSLLTLTSRQISNLIAYLVKIQ